MNLKMMEQFEVMDEEMLSNIEGGVSCFEGVVGIGSLGAGFGPGGAVVGFLGGTGAFCYDTVSWGINEALFYICN